MSRTTALPFVAHGWALYAHPCFSAQINALQEQVTGLKTKQPKQYKTKNAYKRLAAVVELAFDKIPQNPALPEYRQGRTLGPAHTHWCRAKFFQQYRLFFRFHAGSKIIVYAWVNDTDTKRAYGRSDDAYLVFRKMLASGHPPTDWDALLAASQAASDPFGL